MVKEYKSLEFIELCDIYFEKIADDVYTINEAELLKLINRHEYEILFMKNANTKLESQVKRQKQYKMYYRNLAHTYKVELGRCRRKLTRIYRVFNDIETETVTRLIGKCDYRALIWILELIHKIKDLLKAV